MNLLNNFTYLGEISALCAAIFWSIAVIIFKSASTEITPFLITPLKNTIALICFVILFFYCEIPIWYDGFSTIDYLKIIISGFLGMGLADVIFLYALSKIGANRIALVNCFEPAVIYIFSTIMLGTILNLKQLLGFVIVLIAILIITYEKDVDQIKPSIKKKGISLQIIAVILSSFGIVLIKPVLAKVNNSIDLQLWVTAFRLFPGFIIAWVIFLFQDNKLNLLQPLKKSKILKQIIISSGLGTFVALSFWIIGYANIEKPPVASILGQTSVIFIILLSWIFLKEAITKVRLISIFFAISGVYLIIL